MGREADLFLAFPRRRRFGRLAGIEAAGRQLPEVSLHAMPVLPDQDDAPVFLYRNQHDAGDVTHRRDFVLGSVWEAGVLDFDLALGVHFDFLLLDVDRDHLNGGLAFGLWPRGATGFVYGLVVWSFVVETVSAAFDSNHWLRDTSPLLHVAPVPAASPNVTAAVWLVGLGLLAAVGGILAFGRRDLVGD